MLIPMKKATLFALKQDKENILLALQRCGEFMITDPEAGQTSDNLDKTEQDTQRIRANIKFLARFEGKQSPLSPRASVKYDQFILEDEGAIELSRETERVSEELHAVKADVISLASQILQLTPWEPLDFALEKIKPTKYARFSAGYIVPQNADALKEFAAKAGAQIQLLGTGAEGQSVFAIYHAQNEAVVRDAFKAAGFVDAVFPRISGTPKEAIAALRARAEEADKKAAALADEAAALSKKKIALQTLFDRRKAQRDRYAAPFTQSQYTFCMQGWVRKDRMENVREAVSSVSEAYDLGFEDPQEGEIPPTVVQNSAAVQPFEAVTDLYSRPSPFGYDPNSILAVFYFIFFGMMMSDAGYGLVLTALIFGFQKLMKPRGTVGKLSGVLLFGSISTILWGFAFGGLFGISIKPLMFNPMEEPIKMLLLCYALGVVHLFTGMVIKMIINFKAGDWQAAIFDQLSWMLLVLGCIMLALPLTAMVGKVLAIYGFASILLMAGRDKKNILKRLTSGLLALYGITSYLSDILSYSRLFALGLATGVIGMVINTIGKMLMAGQGIAGAIGFVAAIAIFAGGHLFNIVINMLGAFVHTARLQYIEFFGKFYEAGGKEFKPLAISPKYVDILR